MYNFTTETYEYTIMYLIHKHDPAVRDLTPLKSKSIVFILVSPRVHVFESTTRTRADISYSSYIPTSNDCEYVLVMQQVVDITASRFVRGVIQSNCFDCQDIDLVTRNPIVGSQIVW